MSNRDENTVKGAKALTSANTMTNAISFLVEQMVKGMVNTAEVVRVVGVDAGGAGAAAGYVDVLPLVSQTDAWDNALPTTTLYRLPYSRIQGGVAALVIDPIPGDIGLAVFCKRDSSGVKAGASAPVQPASFRSFDQADGFYIGGFLNQPPEIWLELTQEGVATLRAPQKIVLDTPLVECHGRFIQTGQQGRGGQFVGGFTNIGGQVISNTVTLETHTHKGVQSGSGNTGTPNAGT